MCPGSYCRCFAIMLLLMELLPFVFSHTNIIEKYPSMCTSSYISQRISTILLQKLFHRVPWCLSLVLYNIIFLWIYDPLFNLNIHIYYGEMCATLTFLHEFRPNGYRIFVIKCPETYCWRFTIQTV